MRRSVARGRMFPQSYSTDRRYGRLSLKAGFLFPMMWANADDQGRLSGDPEEVKYGVCPNVDHLTKADIPELLKELDVNALIKVYTTPKSAAIQMLDWWDANCKMQWAWPSDFPPPEGWKDHLRYKKDAKTVVTLNWPVSGERSGEDDIISQVSTETPSGEKFEATPLTTPLSLTKTIKRTIRGRGNSPEVQNSSQVSDNNPSGENPHPRRLVLTEQEKGVYETLKENYCMRWGTVHAENPKKIIPRPLKAKDDAQLRDLAMELSDAGCSPDLMIIKQAFDEAAGLRKYSVSYLRAVLLAWLGIERARSP